MNINKLVKSIRHFSLFLTVMVFLGLVASPAQAQSRGLSLKSASALVIDQQTGAVIYEKNPYDVVPIASLTKLMTAMVFLDSKPNLSRLVTISSDDVDTLRASRSRLPVGTVLSLQEMLRLALMSSENRAASALSRNFPGGKPAFVKAMNRKAKMLGLRATYFRDPTGLFKENVSSAKDLSKMVATAYRYPLIREMTTTTTHEQKVGQRMLTYNNTNSLTKNPNWRIGLSKTGYIKESGKCLVMQTWLNDRPTIIVLLDAWGQMTPMADSNRIKDWVGSIAVAENRIRG